MGTKEWKDSNEVSYESEYKGLKNLLSGELLPLELHHYTSLIPSRGNKSFLPFVATYNKYGDNNTFRSA